MYLYIDFWSIINRCSQRKNIWISAENGNAAGGYEHKEINEIEKKQGNEDSHIETQN